MEGEAVDQIEEEVEVDDEERTLCNSCESPIPAARLEAVPGTRYCVSCAEKLQERPVDPFETVTENDAQRFQKKHQQDMEDERRRALPRRSAIGNIKSRWRARKKRKAAK